MRESESEAQIGGIGALERKQARAFRTFFFFGYLGELFAICLLFSLPLPGFLSQIGEAEAIVAFLAMSL